MKAIPFRRLIARVSLIGSDPNDSPEAALQKRLALGLIVGPAPAGPLWSIIYIAAGAHLAGFIPVAYAVIAAANTALFAITRTLALYYL